MFEALGRFVVRRRRAVPVVFVLALVLSGVIGSGLFARLGAGGFDDPGSDSSTAARLLTDTFGQADPAAVLAIEAPRGVDAEAGAATTVVERVAGVEGVERVVSYWTSGRPEVLRSADGRTGQVLVYAGSRDEAELDRLAVRLQGALRDLPPGLTAYAGGSAVVSEAIGTQIGGDLARAEAIAVPITVILLVVVFGSLVAAGLPFLVAAGSVLGTFAVLFLITLTTDVSVFALNLVTGLGLGLGIDYALLIVNRFREELAHGDPAFRDPDGRAAPDRAEVAAAVVRTVASAGRTVVVSGVTVAITMGSLLVFPQYFLRSFGMAGIAVTLIAVVCAVVVLPAVLALLGTKVNRFKVVRSDLTPRDTGAWATVARRVMRSPWPVLVVTLGALLVVAAPTRDVSFGQVDDRALPASSPVAVASQVLRDRFPGSQDAPVNVIVPGGQAAAGAVAEYGRALDAVPGVIRVVPDPQAVDGALRLTVFADVAPRSPDGEALVAALRAVPEPTPGTVIGGVAAEYADSQAGIFDTLPLALAWIVLTTLVVLFLFTGSVLLPVKAILLNLVSLSATLGLLVWIFQEGRMQWLVGDFTVTGTVDTSMVVLIAIVAFALSMDYEVFLLARIKEEHDAGRSTPEAVALGLQRSGRIITAAAALLAVVFAAFVSSGVTSVKQLGLGVAFAILLDATVVRGLLVPATMSVLGRANWWAPAPLRAVHGRFGVSESSSPAPRPTEPEPARILQR